MGEPTDQALAVHVLHGCNTPVMPNGLWSLRVYPDRSPSMMMAHSNIRGANFMFKNSAEIFAYIKKEDVKLVDVRFTDLPGIQHHFNVPVESFD